MSCKFMDSWFGKASPALDKYEDWLGRYFPKIYFQGFKTFF